MATYDAGSLVESDASFTDLDGNLVDPTKVFFEYRIGTGDKITYTYGAGSEIARNSAGKYSVLLDTTGKPGSWAYRWYSEGVGQASVSNQLVVIDKTI